MNIGPYIGIVICIIFSAFFSATEIAFASASRIRLKSKSEAGNKNARLALYISDNFNEALSTILIGNNLVNITASSIAAVIIIDIFGDKGTILSTMVMTVIILIFGEITPKVMAKRLANGYVLYSAYPLRLLMFILKPAVIVVCYVVDLFSKLWEKDEEPSLTEEELVTIIEGVEDEGIIDEDTSDLLQSSLEISSINVSEVITPRTDLLTIDFEDDIDTIIELALDSPYSRIPIYEDSIDNIIGILYVNHLLIRLTENENIDKEEFKWILNDPVYIHQTMKLPEVFDLLNDGKSQMAIVNDEYGGTMGAITIEDILEELVCEIWDEYDEVQDEFIVVAEDKYVVSGDLSIRDFADYLDMEEEYFESEYSTIGGWTIDIFNDLPKENDTMKHNNFIIKILELGSQRISRMQVEVVDAIKED